MSKRTRVEWWRNLRRLVTQRDVPAPPKPPRRSPQGIARAAGWTMEAAGVWAHPDLGTVERQTDGSWQWTSADRTRASYHRTMSEAMKYARVAEPLDGEAAAQGIAGHIRPPWTPDEVATLNAWQHNGEVHPFTCGNDHDGNRVLVATRDGWICPTCDYTQAWAHSFAATREVA